MNTPTFFLLMLMTMSLSIKESKGSESLTRDSVMKHKTRSLPSLNLGNDKTIKRSVKNNRLRKPQQTVISDTLNSPSSTSGNDSPYSTDVKMKDSPLTSSSPRLDSMSQEGEDIILDKIHFTERKIALPQITINNVAKRPDQTSGKKSHGASSHTLTTEVYLSEAIGDTSSKFIIDVPPINMPLTYVITLLLPNEFTKTTQNPHTKVQQRKVLDDFEPKLESGESCSINDERTDTLKTDVHSVKTTLVPDHLLEHIVQHTNKYPSLFSYEGLRNLNYCLYKLKYLFKLQMLLRGDNQYLHQDLDNLFNDYSILLDIKKEDTPENKKAEGLLGIIDSYNKVDLSANETDLSRYQNQHKAIDLIFREYIDLYNKTLNTFTKITEKHPALIRENSDTIKIVHDFIQEYRIMLCDIEEERRNFLYILENLRGNTKREVQLDVASNAFPGLINRHHEAANEKEEKMAAEKKEKEAANLSEQKNSTKEQASPQSSSFTSSARSSEGDSKNKRLHMSGFYKTLHK